MKNAILTLFMVAIAISVLWTLVDAIDNKMLAEKAKSPVDRNQSFYPHNPAEELVYILDKHGTDTVAMQGDLNILKYNLSVKAYDEFTSSVEALRTKQ